MCIFLGALFSFVLPLYLSLILLFPLSFQLMTMHKELHKQMTVMVAVPVTKEGRRLEAAVGRTMEKCVKANADALWARVQEENAKHERLLRDYTQQITSLLTNFTNKDLPAMLEKTVKREITAIGPAVARTITSTIEKTIISATMDTLQVKILRTVASSDIFLHWILLFALWCREGLVIRQ